MTPPTGTRRPPDPAARPERLEIPVRHAPTQREITSASEAFVLVSSLPSSRELNRSSGIAASFTGMLAGLGVLTLVTVVMTAGAVLISSQFNLVATEASLQELAVIGLSAAALIILGSAFVGGFVAGRLATFRGIVVGIGSSLWMTLMVAGFAGLALWLGATSATLEMSGLVDRINEISTVDPKTVAILAATGLMVVALIGGALGGWISGSPDPPTSEAVVDLRTELDPGRRPEVDGPTEAHEQAPTTVRGGV